jgi:hypothetical protein
MMFLFLFVQNVGANGIDLLLVALAARERWVELTKKVPHLRGEWVQLKNLANEMMLADESEQGES